MDAYLYFFLLLYLFYKCYIIEDTSKKFVVFEIRSLVPNIHLQHVQM